MCVLYWIGSLYMVYRTLHTTSHQVWDRVQINSTTNEMEGFVFLKANQHYTHCSLYTLALYS